MALFRRRTPERAPIPAFWEWWNGGAAARLGDRLAAGDAASLVDEISARVAAIDPGLAWDTSAGRDSQHLLSLGSEGDAALRPLAERWLRAAPPADATWSFAASRQRDPAVLTTRLDLGGVELLLGEITAVMEFDDDAALFHVRLLHPRFASAPDAVRAQIAFLVVDWLLGEDDVERWIGRIETASVPDDAAVDLGVLRDCVDAVAAQPVEETWHVLRGRSATGSDILAVARRPLRWIDHPLLDQHASVTLRFDPDDGGMPTPDSLDRLRDHEDRLMEAIGGRGLLLAHETGAGRRTLHVYVDSEDQNGADSIAGFAVRHADTTVEFELDPSWRAMRRFG
ncbi:hypothetical protein AS850_11025 [Frondihabitans sp. 762G35]|uniref:DUF695 domain-containing protein n=1 Tax=Frondihabitans sp. 762G35 TaxID=1446794 RepID=UPI000D2112F1|nr:DUF695 domain-containing protein [Frondihabitans sp. 762G35]ARC57603.1 hypothetical protein AS850_11025 [Frondihabitans sp. 762G35]